MPFNTVSSMESAAGEPGPAGQDGAQGPQGIAGPQGSPGYSTTIKGSVELVVDLPDPLTYVTGDSFIVIENGDLYTRTDAELWENVGQIQGPQGIQGIQGLQGEAGNDATAATTPALIGFDGTGSNGPNMNAQGELATVADLIADVDTDIYNMGMHTHDGLSTMNIPPASVAFDGTGMSGSNMNAMGADATVVDAIADINAVTDNMITHAHDGMATPTLAPTSVLFDGTGMAGTNMSSMGNQASLVDLIADTNAVIDGHITHTHDSMNSAPVPTTSVVFDGTGYGLPNVSNNAPFSTVADLALDASDLYGGHINHTHSNMDGTLNIAPSATVFDGTGMQGPAMSIAADMATVSDLITDVNTLFQSVATPATPLWDDLKVNLVRPATGTNAPTFAQFGDFFYANSFSATAMREMFFEVQLPHSWAEGTSIKPHLHWSSAAGGAGNVVWRLDYDWQNVGGLLENTFNTSVATGTAAAGEPLEHRLHSLGTISGTGKQASSLLICRLYRDATNAADTHGSAAFALSMDFHIQIDKSGSLVEYPNA